MRLLFDSQVVLWSLQSPERDYAMTVQNLPLHHRDPFDRLIIDQAMCEGLTIVTSDRAFAAYDVPILPA